MKLNKETFKKVQSDRAKGFINFELIEYNQAIDLIEYEDYTEEEILSMSIDDIDSIYNYDEDDYYPTTSDYTVKCEKCGQEIGLSYTDNTIYGDGYDGICKCGHYVQMSVYCFED